MPDPAPRPGKHQVRRVVAAVMGTPWAIEESVLNAIVELLEVRAAGKEFSIDEVRLRIGAARSTDDEDEADEFGPRTIDGVAVLPLTGVLAPKMNFFMQISGGTSTQEFLGWFRAALADPDVSAILFDVDSPGGSAQGNEELALEIRAARGKKPIIAAVTGLAASAAYYVASAADKIIVSPSSEVGSIGTFMIHGENSVADAMAGRKYTVIKAGENKAAGNNVEPLSDKAKSVLQQRIDDFNDLFVRAVAANRKVSPETVQKDFGQGKTMIASKAVEAGLADQVGTLEQALNLLRNKKPAASAGSQKPAFSQTQETPVMDATTSAAPASPSQLSIAPAAPVQGASTVLPATAAAPVAPAAPAAPAAVSAADRQKIAESERARIQDLSARAKLLGVAPAQLQQAIDQGTSVADALVAWTDAKTKMEGPVSTARVTENAPDKLFAAASESLARRSTIFRDAKFYEGKKVSPIARDLQGKTMMQLAELFVGASGSRPVSGDADEIARMALAGDGRSITVPRGEDNDAVFAGDVGYDRRSDFPNLLSNLMGKMMDIQLTFAPATYDKWAYQLPPVADFKPKTIIAVGEFAEFPRVPGNADFTESTIGEEASWIQADKYGDEWTLTPEMVQDDGLGALEEVVRDKVLAHELTLNRLCINLLVGNATAGDGNNVFDSSNHGNDRTSGGAPSTTELAAMRLLFRLMKGVSKKRRLNLTLKGLLVPAEVETAAQQLLALVQGVVTVPVPVTTATVELFRGNVEYWVDPMLSENSTTIYYGFAERNSARAIIYCHQQGFEGLKTRNYYWPKNNARVFQFEGRFAAAVRNWRGIVRNNGA
jgi:signal peptide peptidase SppA